MTQGAVRDLLVRFQAGYTARNLDHLDDFMTNFVPSDDIEAIGTKGIHAGEEEWCVGLDAVRGLIEDDWKGWGDVVFDVDGARIHVQGDVAWLSCSATATLRIPFENISAMFLAQAGNTMEDEDLTPEQKMLEVTRLGADIYFEMPMGEIFVWPFRFAAVAVIHDGAWRFHQMQFSYSNTRLPDVRMPSS